MYNVKKENSSEKLSLESTFEYILFGLDFIVFLKSHTLFQKIFIGLVWLKFTIIKIVSAGICICQWVTVNIF